MAREWPSSSAVTGIGNKDTLRGECHFVRRFTVRSNVGVERWIKRGREIRIDAGPARDRFYPLRSSSSSWRREARRDRHALRS